MTKVRVSSIKPPAFNLERLTQVLPSEWLQRLADPSANYRGGAMVRTEPAGDDVAEFRCYLGMLIPGEMDNKALGQWIEKERDPQAYELIMLLYRTFGPMNWGRIGREFDALCLEQGNAVVGAWVRENATRELMLREEIPHEKRVAQLVEAWRAE